jgi:D-lactate dehydrogenase (cytochrome)
MQVKTDRDQLLDYLTDASNMAGGHAEKLFIPETAGEVSDVVREANERGVPVTISGARTGTVGGAIPFGGYVVSMERLNGIVELDRSARKAVVGAGLILADFQTAVSAENLFYPPDPTEWSCQIGGTVATNASGSRSFKYGPTRNYVQGLKAVLPTGDSVELRRGEMLADESGVLEIDTDQGNRIRAKVPDYRRPHVRKNVSGYYNRMPLDAIDLFIGSEGTLGVITQVELSLLPKPEGLFSGVIFFAGEEDLLSFVNEVRNLSFEHRGRSDADLLEASLIEYFDRNALEFIREKFPDVPENMEGAIFFEQETSPASEDGLFEAWNALLEKHGASIDDSWFTTSDRDREKMREFRHSLPVAVNERIARYGQRKVGTDMAVPDDRFAGFLRFYKNTLSASGLDHVIFGHIGDNHLHANLLPKNEPEAETARHIYGRCVAHAIMLGGTVSAEHGIGKLKRKYLDAMMGERYLNEMAELKHAFDPNGILGRGNMFDVSYLGQKAGQFAVDRGER